MIPFFASICCEAGAILAPPHSNHWRPKSARRFSSCSRATYPPTESRPSKKSRAALFSPSERGLRSSSTIDFKMGGMVMLDTSVTSFLGVSSTGVRSLNLYWTWGSACSFSSRTRPGQRSSEIRNQRRGLRRISLNLDLRHPEVRASASLEGDRPKHGGAGAVALRGPLCGRLRVTGNEASSPRPRITHFPSPALAALGVLSREREREMKRERGKNYAASVSFTAATSCLSVKGFGRKAYWPCSGRFFWNASSA